MDELNALTADPDLWNDAVKAQKLMTERNTLSAAIDRVTELETEISNTYEMIEMAESENEPELLAEAEKTFTALEPKIQEAELESLLSAEGDKNDAFLDIHSGAGGTEAQDLADMLRRMYMHWGEKNG